MKPTVVVNDIHLGVSRVAGTTPATQKLLRESLLESFKSFIFKHATSDLCILGDLFDAFEVDVEDILDCYMVLSQWLSAGCDTLILVAGNHDIGKRNDILSSFDILCRLLTDRYPSRVKVIREGLVTVKNLHIIPHCMNQDLFDIELEKALHVEPGFLLLHANVDNGFAEDSDHSLNVSGDWLKKLSKLHTVCFAHEHQGRNLNYGFKTGIVFGNQYPSSISDCLAHGQAQKDGIKAAHILNGDGSIEPIKTWQREGDFVEMDWNELSVVEERFIRVTGTATAKQASDAVSVVAKYRQVSPALVISNAIKVEGLEGIDDLAEQSFEHVTSFNVLNALLEHLTKEEGAFIKHLLGLSKSSQTNTIEESKEPC